MFQVLILGEWGDVFASVPPITALRTWFTLTVTGRNRDAEEKLCLCPMAKDTCLIFIDRHQESTFLESSREAAFGRAT